ncbi:MAG: hypothetical protein NWF13_10030 [Candidatus Bathyarchaeota archaeon]|nr:hypothetical protein [Candidatus Bathyarchaeota archaeon]
MGVAKLRAKGLDDEEAAMQTLCGALGIEPVMLDAFQPKNPKMIVSEFELTKYMDARVDMQTILPSERILIQRDYEHSVIPNTIQPFPILSTECASMQLIVLVFWYPPPPRGT